MRIATYRLIALVLGCLAQQSPAQQPLVGHTNQLSTVAVSHDGEFVLTSGGTTAILWDVATGKSIRTFDCGSRVSGVSMSGDGKSILTGLVGGSILWEATSGEKLHTFVSPKPNQEVDQVSYHTGHVALSSDGKFAVNASYNNTALVWDAVNGKLLHTLKGHTKYVTSVALTRDGKWVATGSGDNTAILWDTASGRAIRTFEVPAPKYANRRVLCVSLTADGKLLATGSRGDGTTILWETATGKKLQTLKGGYQFVWDASLSEDGKHVVTAGGVAVPPAILWDVATGKKLHEFKAPRNGAVISGDGSRVVTFTQWKGLVSVWESATGKKLQTLKVGPDQYPTRKAR